MSQVRIGISGFRYAEWRGMFYPKGLAQRKELEFAAQHFNSIELNGSFYSLQRPVLYRAWYAATPADFIFAVKGGRYITHMKKLRDVETPLANFFASGLLALEEKLGPILWQFPASLPCDTRFEEFFARLPRTTREAAQLAGQHSPWLADRVLTETKVERPLRHAVEVRSRSCGTEAFMDSLRRHGIALVVADTARKFPYWEDVTADFVYVRLHGDAELYKSGYSRAAIAHWGERVRCWLDGREPDDAQRVGGPAPKLAERDVYVYFDNDVKSHAPYDALHLADYVEAGQPSDSGRAAQ